MPTPSNAIEINDGSHKSGRSTRRSGSRSAHDDGLDSFSKGDSGAGASAGSSNSRFRHRKISVKQHLKIYLPNDLKHLDKDELQQREVVEIETGVEKMKKRRSICIEYYKWVLVIQSTKTIFRPRMLL